MRMFLGAGTAFCMVFAACGGGFDLERDIWSRVEEFRIRDYAGLVKESGVDFRILQFTDAHINTWYDSPEALERTYTLMTRAIEETKPNLLVLTGDNVGNFMNSVWAQQLVTFLDTFRIPYAMTMGNHDGESASMEDGNLQRIVAEIFRGGRYSLFENGPDNIGGTGNYGVNLFSETGDVLYGLVLLDSNRDYIRLGQVDWYEWYIRGVEGTAGAAVRSLVFFHIPLPEIRLIRQEMEELGRRDETGRSVDEAFGEPPNAQSLNTGLFERMKGLGSTTHIFFGHDHLNALDYEYEGIHFVYGLKTGYCGYNDADSVGAVLIVLSGDAAGDMRVAVDFRYLRVF
jgi:hypothetical protein